MHGSFPSLVTPVIGPKLPSHSLSDSGTAPRAVSCEKGQRGSLSNQGTRVKYFPPSSGYGYRLCARGAPRRGSPLRRGLGQVARCRLPAWQTDDPGGAQCCCRRGYVQPDSTFHKDLGPFYSAHPHAVPHSPIYTTQSCQLCSRSTPQRQRAVL